MSPISIKVDYLMEPDSFYLIMIQKNDILVSYQHEKSG